MSDVRLKIENVLVCDDIRTEDNGKALIIGVYTGSISPSKFPARIRLCYWLVGKVQGQGSFKLEVRIAFKPDDQAGKPAEMIVGLEGAVTERVEEPREVQLAVGGESAFEFSGPGNLSVAVRAGDEEFQDVAVKPVLLAVRTSSAPPPPS